MLPAARAVGLVDAPGAPVSGSWRPTESIGNTMTSRMLSFAREQRDEAVDAEGEAGVRRRAEPERIEEESEPRRLRLCASMPIREKICCCISGEWIRTLPEPRLPAVQHDVVGLRPHVDRASPVDVSVPRSSGAAW